MTNQQILEKAIAKAIENAWEFDNLDKWEWHAIKKTDTVMTDWYYFILTHDGEERFIDAYRVIFHSDFAKALWGTRFLKVIDTDLPMLPAWQFHLQQMVIADNPIAYLGDNLPQ